MVMIISSLSGFPLDEPNHSPGQLIVGGNETTIDKIPFQVSLRYMKQHHCGGSIISPKHVVTAAHCIINGVGVSNYSVMAGSTKRTGDENRQIRLVRKIVKHPKYIAAFYSHDIALIFVSSFEFNSYVNSIYLPEAGAIPRPDAVTVASGWGTTQPDNNTLPEILKYVKLTVVSISDCNATMGGSIRKGMICAGGKEIGKDTCQMDSGGPLTLDGTLIGVTSWGKHGCGQGYPGVYAHVSYYLEWVLKTVSLD